MNIARDICQKSKLQDDDDHYTELERTHHSMCADKVIIYRGSCVETISDLTRFNKIAIKSTAQMAVDKDVVGLSRVRMYESNNYCIMPLRDNCIFCY